MRSFTFVAVLFGLTGSTAAPQQPEAKQKTDQELFQGIWEIVGLENGGKAQPNTNFQGNTLTFTKDKLLLKEGIFPPLEFTFCARPNENAQDNRIDCPRTSGSWHLQTG